MITGVTYLIATAFAALFFSFGHAVGNNADTQVDPIEVVQVQDSE